MAFDNMYLQGNEFVPGTDWITIGVKLRFDTVDPGDAFHFLRVSRSAIGAYHLAMQFTGEAGRIQVLEADASSAYLSPAGLLVADREYLFEMKFKRTGTSDFLLWLDGSLLQSINNRNFDDGTNIARIEVRTQTGAVSPTPSSPRCQVYTSGWYIRTDDESTATWIEFVGFEGAGFEEVELFGASTIETTPAPANAKETYICKVVADTGATPDD